MDETLMQDANFWDKAARKYSKSKIGDEKGYQKTINRCLELLNAGNKVLELGCGTGTTALKLAPKVSRFIATDISTGMIEISNEKLVETPIPSLSFSAKAVDQVTHLEDGYDAVLGFNYLHLVEDPERVILQIRKLLKKDGLFISKTPSLKDMNFLIQWAIPIMRMIGFAPASISKFSSTELQQMIVEAGFKIDALEWHGTKGKDSRPFIVARKV